MGVSFLQPQSSKRYSRFISSKPSLAQQDDSSRGAGCTQKVKMEVRQSAGAASPMPEVSYTGLKNSCYRCQRK